MEHRLYGPWWRGVLLGLVATFAGLAVGELMAGLFRGASSPVLPVGQEVIDAVPRSVKNWAIETFGTADKAVLIIGTIVSLAVIGSIVGVLAVRGRLLAACSVSGVVGLIGVLAVLDRPDPTFVKLLPPIVGTIASIAALWWLAPTTERVVTTTAPGDLAPDVASAAPRRSFLQGATTVAIASVVAGVAGRSLKGRFSVDDEIATLDLPDTVPGSTLPSAPDTSEFEFGVDDVQSWAVPNREFYRIDTALSVPQVPRDSWSLKIHGMVDQEIELTFADVLARPMIERWVTLSCVSNEVGGDLVGNALFQGIRLKELLEEAGIQDGATQVVSRSVDGWTCGSPTSAIMDGRDAMLAIAMNGEPLPAEHGYPARLVVPGLYGYVSATKWVSEIELMRWEDFDGYWVPRGWAKEAPVKTMARIDRPRSGQHYEPDADGVIAFGGLAWAVHRGVGAVEVQIDEGEWRECELAGVPSDDTWRQWRYLWRDAEPGKHEIRVRAADAAGEPQPEEPKAVAPDGAQGYHRKTFYVD